MYIMIKNEKGEFIMNKDFELLLKVISKGTIDTVEEFEAFWNKDCINNPEWTELYFGIYGYDSPSSGNRAVDRIYIDILETCKEFESKIIERFRETFKDQYNNNYESFIQLYLSNNFDPSHFVRYIKANFKNESDGYWVYFENISSSESFIEFIKNNCNNDFEKYLYLHDGIFEIVDEEDIESDDQEDSIKIRDFLDNFVNND